MKKFTLSTIILLYLAFAGYAQKNGTGLKFDDKAYNALPMKAPLTRELYTEIPKTYSLKKFAPEPLSQGQFGTCTGWATAYAALTILHCKKNNITDKDKIAANAFLPGFIYKQIKSEDDNTCTYGASIADALEIMKTRGAAKFDLMEEKNCPDEIPFDVFNSARQHKIIDYAKIFGTEDPKKFKISAVKKSISQGNPVVIGMNCPNSFYDAGEFWEPTESADEDYGGHAMCVIGYDDKKGKNGAFEIMNSWGTEWADSGFVFIEYDIFSNFVKYAYEMIDIASTNEPRGYDLEGSIKFVKSTGEESSAKKIDTGYKLYEAYKSGTKFRLIISNSAPAYVYAFGSDSTQKVFPVFPHNKRISPALTYAENAVAIPDQESYIQTDNTLGTDYLCVVYSKKYMDFDEMVNKVQTAQGTNFRERVNSVFSQDLIMGSDIEFSQDIISFKAKSSQKNLVYIIVETEHIE